MVTIVRYSPQSADAWDRFVAEAKNGLFLFYRGYMDYHAERFPDHSLMCYQGKRLMAVLPATSRGNLLLSHGGLTFGSWVTDRGMTTSSMMELFDALRAYLVEQAFATLIYKCIPHIYHVLPAEEDRYALFRVGARLCRREVTSTIDLRRALRFQERRRRSIKKAVGARLVVKQTEDFPSYWKILEENLSRRHGVKPAHSVEEIEHLHRKFPANVRLFASYQGKSMLAGVLVFEHRRVAHAQYIANSPEGERRGALDAVFDELINRRYRDKEYFDFGISTEHDGTVLNTGLIAYKEGFGGCAVVHDTYEMDVFNR